MEEITQKVLPEGRKDFYRRRGWLSPSQNSIWNTRLTKNPSVSCLTDRLVARATLTPDVAKLMGYLENGSYVEQYKSLPELPDYVPHQGTKFTKKEVGQEEPVLPFTPLDVSLEPTVLHDMINQAVELAAEYFVHGYYLNLDNVPPRNPRFPSGGAEFRVPRHQLSDIHIVNSLVNYLIAYTTLAFTPSYPR